MRVFFDIDTQIDFMYPAGALYGKGGEQLIVPVATLSHFAVRNNIPLVSTMCAHGENSTEFRSFPPHCISGTTGQNKPAALLFARRYVVPNRPVTLHVPGDTEQIIIEKDDLDLFTNPNTMELLNHLQAEECVVYGAFTDYCVRCAVNGLLETGRKVTLVQDAIAALNPEKGSAVIDAFVQAGGRLTTIAEVLESQ